MVIPFVVTDKILLTDEEREYFTVFYVKHVQAFKEAGLIEIWKTYDTVIKQVPITDALINILGLESMMIRKTPNYIEALMKALKLPNADVETVHNGNPALTKPRPRRGRHRRG